MGAEAGKRGLDPVVAALTCAVQEQDDRRFRCRCRRRYEHLVAVRAPVDDDFALHESCVAHRCRSSVHWQRSARSEEHTSELQSLMRISYAVFCLKKKKTQDRTLKQ